jgi:hypothetical protein
LYLNVPKSGQVRSNIIFYSIHSSIKRQSKHEQNTEDQVRKEGGEPNSLAEGLDTLDENWEYDDPGKKETASKFPADSSNLDWVKINIEGYSWIQIELDCRKKSNYWSRVLRGLANDLDLTATHIIYSCRNLKHVPVEIFFWWSCRVGTTNCLQQGRVFRVYIHTVGSVPAGDSCRAILLSSSSSASSIPVSTSSPRQLSRRQAVQDSSKVVDDPGNDDIVVEADTNDNQKHGISNTYNEGYITRGTQKYWKLLV